MFVARQSSTIDRTVASARRYASPWRRSSTYRVRSRLTGFGLGTNTATIAADSTNVAASTSSMFGAPSSTIRMPATG